MTGANLIPIQIYPSESAACAVGVSMSASYLQTRSLKIWHVSTYRMQPVLYSGVLLHYDLKYISLHYWLL